MIEISPREAVDLEIVIPAFNEERRIGSTVEAVVTYMERQSYRSALVVVDNGSGDRRSDPIGYGRNGHRDVNMVRRRPVDPTPQEQT